MRKLLPLLVCLLSATTLSADDFSESDLYPFVHVHGSRVCGGLRCPGDIRPAAL